MLTHMHATLGADDDNGEPSHTICTHHCFFIATSLQSCVDDGRSVFFARMFVPVDPPESAG